MFVDADIPDFHAAIGGREDDSTAANSVIAPDLDSSDELAKTDDTNTGMSSSTTTTATVIGHWASDNDLQGAARRSGLHV